MSELTCRAGMKLIAGSARETDPQKKIAPFCIDEHEVTQAEFAADEFSKPGAQFQLICTSPEKVDTETGAGRELPREV